MLDLKHLREFAFSMTARQSGKSIVALIDEIEALQAENARLREALGKAKTWFDYAIGGDIMNAENAGLVNNIIKQALSPAPTIEKNTTEE